jgi:hypothetical protein
MGDALLATRFIFRNRCRAVKAMSSVEVEGEDGGVGGGRWAALATTSRMRETDMVASEAISRIRAGDFGEVVNTTK